MPRTVNQATIDLVKHFEGLYLEAYQCPAGVWTIGYGHTGLNHQDGTVKKGRVITKEEAEELLAYDLGQFAPGVEKLLFPRPREEMNDNQFGALVSFAFNVGLENFGGCVGRFAKNPSTLLQRINARRYADCPAEFLKWNRAAGKVLRGLTRRRQSEANLFMSLPNWLVKA